MSSSNVLEGCVDSKQNDSYKQPQNTEQDARNLDAWTNIAALIPYQQRENPANKLSYTRNWSEKNAAHFNINRYKPSHQRNVLTTTETLDPSAPTDKLCICNCFPLERLNSANIIIYMVPFEVEVWQKNWAQKRYKLKCNQNRI